MKPLYFVVVFVLLFCRCGNGQEIKPLYPEKWDEIENYIRNNWLKYIGTKPDLPKPYSYALNPGTLYYWDLYFINEGLMSQGFNEQALNNIDDFIFEIEKLGFIPNAMGWGENRSQTPYFGAMVRSYYDNCSTKDKAWLAVAYHALLAEYEFWTNSNGNQIEDHTSTIDGLQHFGNHADTAYSIDFYKGTLTRIPRLNPATATLEDTVSFSNHRIAEAETMDFTNRFEGRCMDFIAVDLNSNLWYYEMCLAYFERELGISNGKTWEQKAKTRAELINRYCWSEERGLYLDYDYVNGRHSSVASVATLMPLYWGFADKKRAAAVRRNLTLFDSDGGLVVCEPTDEQYHYQWGDKAVWAPVQFLAIRSMKRYGFKADAERYAMKFLNTVTKNFVEPYPNRNGARKPGFLWEKFTREGDINDDEYTCNHMMGWTAATFLEAKKCLVPR
ncbi:MAG: trehalase [Tannerella sp.]|jgi:alpha,alpha-trehalase|nr:trehalase [Tannerella sp.]